MKIACASDHAGFQHKTAIKEWLTKKGHEVLDFGTDSEIRVDYPKFIRRAAESVAAGECKRGIVIGGSGNGEAIVANRLKGIRCTLCWNKESARLARAHNDANMLALGQRLLPWENVQEIIEEWLSTPFDGGRHTSRIQQIDM